nr:hypothetical protein [Halopelagius longus]
MVRIGIGVYPQRNGDPEDTARAKNACSLGEEAGAVLEVFDHLPSLDDLDAVVGSELPLLFEVGDDVRFDVGVRIDVEPLRTVVLATTEMEALRLLVVLW